jgi:hypothetical protein
MTAVRKDTIFSLEIGRFLAASAVLLTHFRGDFARHGNGPMAKFLAAINPPAPAAWPCSSSARPILPASMLIGTAG